MGALSILSDSVSATLGRLMRMSAHELPRTLDAVLWDMDGTLIDTEPLWLQAETAMLRRYGLELNQELRDNLIGSGLVAAAEIFQRIGVPMETDEIIAEWAQGVSARLKGAQPDWRPGAVELLASLKEAQIPCALVTMSVRSLADQVVDLLPEGTFSAIVAGDEVEHEKPHPDPYLRGAAALDVNISHCVAFEDSPTGLRSASASGAVAIGIPNLLPLSSAPADDLWPTLAGHTAITLKEQFRRLAGQRAVTSHESGL